MKPEAGHKSQLIHVLHMAYSGEKAAAYAYNAHWKSLKNPTERQSIRRIENEELEHRAIVGVMLKKLGDGPQPWRELMMACIGRTVGAACFVIGWFLPMYFAGRLESSNIKEYDVAAGHAEALGMPDDAKELLRLSAVEAQHEEFFLQTIANHPLLPLMGRISLSAPFFNHRNHYAPPVRPRCLEPGGRNWTMCWFLCWSALVVVHRVAIYQHCPHVSQEHRPRFYHILS
jgi:rubrerythrin